MSRFAVALALPVLLLAIVLYPSSARAWTDEQDYIRDPATIPRFTNFTNPTIEPGFSSTMTFIFKNRYDRTISGANLTVQIYGIGTIDYEKQIKDAKDPPVLSQGPNPQSVTLNLNSVGSGVQLMQTVTIKTTENTEEGTYFVRFSLTFTYNGSNYKMLSRGYISDADWDWATNGNTQNISSEEVGIDMPFLFWKYGCIAIIPDTAFSVRSPIPLWPLYVLGALAITFAVLATIFFLQEEQGRFPKLEQGLQKWTGKYYQTRRFLKKRSGKPGSEV